MSDFARPVKELLDSGIPNSVDPAAGMGLTLDEKGNIPAGVSTAPWREVGATGEPAFSANWSNLGAGAATTAFVKDPLGYVWMKGLVVKSVAPAAADVIFTLPVGCRPALNQHYAVWSGGVVVFGAVRVDSDGSVRWYAGAADGITGLNINFRTF